MLFLFPFSVVIGLADPLAAGQVTEAQHGHSATGDNEMLHKKFRHFKGSMLLNIEAYPYGTGTVLLDPNVDVKISLQF